MLQLLFRRPRHSLSYPLEFQNSEHSNDYNAIFFSFRNFHGESFALS
jgi:hypothetical protein